ncbi:MAG TPA: hypothetical protein DF383_12080 [Deltaproteobacteria bacterium]|nr:hypothetical protein [Deltaproteobacteria bacterium]
MRKDRPLIFLKMTLYALAIFHVLVGMALVVSKTAQFNLTFLYGATLTSSDQSSYLLRIIGSFAFALGLMLWLAARDPLKYKWIVLNAVIFFAFRNIQRSIFIQEVESLEISATKNWLTNLFFWLLVIGLLAMLGAAGKRKALSDKGEKATKG